MRLAYNPIACSRFLIRGFGAADGRDLLMNPLLTATQLQHWADEHRSQDMLPLLMRRLILAIINPLKIDFPSGDSINRPGFDGVLQTIDGELLIPAGQAAWEMGVRRFRPRPGTRGSGSPGRSQNRCAQRCSEIRNPDKV